MFSTLAIAITFELFLFFNLTLNPEHIAILVRIRSGLGAESNGLSNEFHAHRTGQFAELRYLPIPRLCG